MGRLPFDPGRMQGAKPTSGERTGGSEPLSVSALAGLIERAVAGAFPARLTVRGEVSGTRQRTHWYFNLKDEGAVIGAVMFASSARRAGVLPADGRSVLASGRLEYYKPQGRLTLVVDRLTEEGAGSLDAQFRRLCEELRELGWFDPQRKQPLPIFPRRIAVLTSASSAALQDVLDTTRRRCCAVDLLLVDVPVQGAGAAAKIARALREIDRRAASLGVEAILLTRGGGSQEDLWCFNDRALAEAVVRCRIPVVAAIGHESDTTIVELVADERAATPTQAAMRLTPDKDALDRQLATLSRRLRHAARTRCEGETRRVRALGGRPVLTDPRQIVRIQAGRIDELGRWLRSAMLAALHARQRALARAEIALERRRPTAEQARRRAEVEALAARLRRAGVEALTRRRAGLERLEAVCEAVGPIAVLRRGYSVTRRPDGSIIRRTGDARPGEALLTRLADGEIRSVVDGATPPPAPDRPKPSRRTTGPGGPDDAPQMDLFGGPG